MFHEGLSNSRLFFQHRSEADEKRVLVLVRRLQEEQLHLNEMRQLAVALKTQVIFIKNAIFVGNSVPVVLAVRQHFFFDLT